MRFIAKPAEYINGTLRVPGDKSISHRAIIFGSLANGVTKINGFLQGEDSLATIQSFQNMGVNIINKDNIIIHGVGMHGLKAPKHNLNVGNAGTGMRLLTGLLAGQKFKSVITGDNSLSNRPMLRILNPLGQMGANITASKKNTAPLRITGQDLFAIEYPMPIASAQLKSAILLAGMYANGTTCVIESEPSRDHTERMLQGFGYPLSIDNNKICIIGGGQLTATNIDVPADISSASFFIVAAIIAHNSSIILHHVGINPTRNGIIEILNLMGADIKLKNQSIVSGEPVADIYVKSSVLHGICIPKQLIPLAIDEFPVLFIAAAYAKGETILTGAEELRVKESDRIAVMTEGMKNLGIDVTPTQDGVIIKGGKPICGGIVNSYGDHRIAMSFAVCSLVADDSIIIEDCENVNTSFPGFVKQANSVGLRITIE